MERLTKCGVNDVVRQKPTETDARFEGDFKNQETYKTTQKPRKTTTYCQKCVLQRPEINSGQ